MNLSLLAVWAVMMTAAAPRAVAADAPSYRLLRLDGRLVKWGEAALGRPAHVTYAFAETSVRDASARNCKAMEPLAGLARRSGLAMADIERQVEQAFAAWQARAGVTFSRAASPQEADILIGAQANPRGYAFANVRTSPAGGVSRAPARGGEFGLNHAASRGLDRVETVGVPVAAIEKSAICLNPERDWKIGFGGPGAGYDLRYTFTHEIGHAIGLNHANRPGELMYFKYSEEFSSPQAGDVQGLAVLYGSAPAGPEK